MAFLLAAPATDAAIVVAPVAAVVFGLLAWPLSNGGFPLGM